MRTLILALLFTLFVSIITPAYATTGSTGTLTEAQGTVFTRGFVDQNKTVWAEPTAAHVGDAITDGMQIGTGKESTAQITWDNVTTRVWHNTVYSVMPNQKLVYLIGGGMMFNHDRKKGDRDYTIWTKHLQVVARGTTLLVQEGRDGSRVSVIEGVAEITNRLDKSILTLTPGMSYEARPKAGRNPDRKHHERKQRKTGKPTSPVDTSDLDILDLPVDTAVLENMAIDKTVSVFANQVGFQLLDLPGTVNAVADLVEELLLFDSLDVTSYVSSVPSSILDDKLFGGFQKQLLKQQFINKQLLKSLNGKQSVFKNLRINQLPLVGNYGIGSDVLSVASLPMLASQHFSPTSVIPSGTDPLGLGKNLGLKRYRISYGRNQTRLNAIFVDPSSSMKGKRGGVPALASGSGLPVNSLSSLTGNKSTNVVPTAALLGSRGSLLGSKGGALSPVTGLTGPSGLGNTLNSVTRSVGGLGGILGR